MLAWAQPPRAVAVQQEKLLPAEASPLYLGMPSKELKKAFKLSEFDTAQGGPGDLNFSRTGGVANINTLSFKVSGISPAGMSAVVERSHKVQGSGEEVNDFVFYLSKIPDAAYVSEIGVTYVPRDGLEEQLKTRYGTPSPSAGPGYDLGWTLKSPDGLSVSVAFRRRDNLLVLTLK